MSHASLREPPGIGDRARVSEKKIWADLAWKFDSSCCPLSDDVKEHSVLDRWLSFDAIHPLVLDTLRRMDRITERVRLLSTPDAIARAHRERRRRWDRVCVLVR
mmetsp:Transcript_16773/g.52425  ORF Transcript_16773/g.52425 Transcript_16773/m.52425 type:complete len:104 (-) Transcript_16773:364-675(-)